jgi:DNA invertase Pin-like site-specific DNA recombinase
MRSVGGSTSWSSGGWDRLGRNLKHLVTLLEDVQAVGIAFVSLGEGIDCTTAAGRL